VDVADVSVGGAELTGVKLSGGGGSVSAVVVIGG